MGKGERLDQKTRLQIAEIVQRHLGEAASAPTSDSDDLLFAVLALHLLWQEDPPLTLEVFNHKLEDLESKPGKLTMLCLISPDQWTTIEEKCRHNITYRGLRNRMMRKSRSGVELPISEATFYDWVSGKLNPWIRVACDEIKPCDLEWIATAYRNAVESPWTYHLCKCHRKRKEPGGTAVTGPAPTQMPWILPAGGNLDRPETRYDLLFKIFNITITYVTLINSFEDGGKEFQRGDLGVEPDDREFKLPDDLDSLTHNVVVKYNDDKVKILDWGFTGQDDSDDGHKVKIRFSRIKYLDQAKTAGILDAPIPGRPGKTFRDKYAPSLAPPYFPGGQLPYLCGVGIFIITSDDKIIITQQSSNVSVYPARFSYSASGSMDWHGGPDPFQDVDRECREELGHVVVHDEVRLFSLGVDAKDLYVQFSFFERTKKSSDEILAGAPHARDYNFEINQIMPISFNVNDVLKELTDARKSWEPAAGAALLTLCIKRFGLDAIKSRLAVMLPGIF
jgi:hypothetical protein